MITRAQQALVLKYKKSYRMMLIAHGLLSQGKDKFWGHHMHFQMQTAKLASELPVQIVDRINASIDKAFGIKR